MIEVVSAAIYNQQRLLLAQRSPRSSHPWKWVTVGGKVERGESHMQALLREISEELGDLACNALPEFKSWSRVYTHDVPSTRSDHVVRVYCYGTQASRPDAFAAVPEHGVLSVGWFTAAEVRGLSLGPADAANIDILARGCSDV